MHFQVCTAVRKTITENSSTG